MDFTKNIEELEELGYTLLPRFIDRETTADIRRFIDAAIANRQYSGAERGSSTYHYRVCSPIDHPISAQLASDRRILEVATKSLRAENLRLRQQMFMLTTPCGEPPPPSLMAGISTPPSHQQSGKRHPVGSLANFSTTVAP